MAETVKIPLDEANFKQLAYYASTILNLDIPRGSNGTQVRAKILAADPNAETIMVPASMVEVQELRTAAPTLAKAAPKPAPAPAPSGSASMHFRHDPKVEVTIQTSSDATRAKDVQLACQGDVVIIKRGKRVSIPYRHYLVLDEAVETVARETDEINPNTGLPIKEWVEQHSYPFVVHALPSDDDIAAWERRMARMELA